MLNVSCSLSMCSLRGLASGCATSAAVRDGHELVSHVTQAPLIAVGLFGVYSVSALAYGLLTFRDCPEEAASLQQVCVTPWQPWRPGQSHAASTSCMASLSSVSRDDVSAELSIKTCASYWDSKAATCV